MTLGNGSIAIGACGLCLFVAYVTGDKAYVESYGSTKLSISLDGFKATVKTNPVEPKSWIIFG